jgi:Chromosome segregation ATPases
VNNLLETLDTGVENVVEHRAGKYSEDEDDNIDYAGNDVGGQSSVDDILAKRGLLLSSQEEEEEDNDLFSDGSNLGNVESHNGVIDQGQNNKIQKTMDNVIEGEGKQDKTTTETEAHSLVVVGQDALVAESNLEKEHSPKKRDGSSFMTTQMVEEQLESNGPWHPDDENYHDLTPPQNYDKDMSPLSKEEISEKHNNSDDMANAKDASSKKVVEMESNEVPTQDIGQTQSIPGTKVSETQIQIDRIQILQEQVDLQKKLLREALDEKKEAVKESRKLRRNIVKLNAELDSAERELDAQRTELTRAAARIDKDRQRFKEEKEHLEMSHKEDLKSIAEEHRASVTVMTNAHSKQIADMEDRIRRAEEARAKEGGDMSAELAESAERERDAMKQIRVLEEEKSTLIAQVSSLKTQIGGLESRVEMSQQAADSASERERDADDRLDATLSLHARQLSLRQAREAELDRTISDLTAALVESRARETALLKKRDSLNLSDEGAMNTIAELKDKLLGAKDEVEMLNNQLMIEKHKAEMLQQELEDLSREQEQEASKAASRQMECDQRIAELNATISKLRSQNSGKNFTGLNSIGGATSVSDSVVQKLQTQVASLSEDRLRYKEKLQYSSTEIQTLRNRLNSALSRAEIAEKAASSQSYYLESDGFRSKERLSRKKMTVTSIRSALKLDAGRGETREIVGKIIDTIDTVAVDMGSYFRSDPFARGFFLMYLMILHAWAFCLLIFHAHGTLEPAPDVGPEELLKHSYRHYEQVSVP